MEGGLITPRDVLALRKNMAEVHALCDEYARAKPKPGHEYGPNEWPEPLVQFPDPLPERALNVICGVFRWWNTFSWSERHRAVTPFKVSHLKGVDLLREYNFGRKSLEDVRKWLKQYGMTLADDREFLNR